MYPVLIAGSMVMLRELTDADTAALHRSTAMMKRPGI